MTPQQQAHEGCDTTGTAVLISESGSDLLISSSEARFNTPTNTEERKSHFPIPA